MAQKLALQRSPQQISGWLKQEFPAHQDMQISHEAIYRSLFIQTRGVLKKELTAQLRTARQMPRPKPTQRVIRQRPAEIEDRAVPGHWEGDLLTGANDTHITTLIERNTRFTMLVKIPRKDTTTVVAALAKQIGTASSFESGPVSGSRQWRKGTTVGASTGSRGRSARSRPPVRRLGSKPEATIMPNRAGSAAESFGKPVLTRRSIYLRFWPRGINSANFSKLPELLR